MVQPELGLVQLRRLWLLSCAALLALGGCVCNQDLCVVTGATPVSPSFATAWQPVTVTALLPVSCGMRVPTSVTVSVLDPSSNPIAHTSTEPRATNDGFETDVSFTPTVPGTYHLAARFEPNFGTAQANVIVAAERRDAGSILVPGRCDRGDFTPGGLVLCRNADTVDVLDAGRQFEGFPFVARWSSTLWLSTGTRLERWVEDGGSFELTDALMTSAHQAIIPGADEALLLGLNSATWLWRDGGVTSVPAPIRMNNVLWRTGNDVAFIRGNQWCAARIPGYVADGGQRCTMLTSPTAVALGPEGIWVQNETMLGSEVMLVDHRMSTGFPLPPGWAVFVPGPFGWDNGVVLDAGRPDAGPFVLARSGDNIVLENYGPRVQAITSTCVTVPEGSSTRLYRR